MKASVYRPKLYKSTLMTAVFAGLVLMSAFAGQAAAQKVKPGAKVKPAVSKVQASATAIVKCPGTNGLSTEEINEIVAIHAFDRAAYGVSALKWDCRLASYAQEWANKSVFAHREDNNYGESMFVGSNGGETIRAAMDRWLAEKAFWTNKTGSCTAGKTCTHFTQMVWRTSLKVGCGINRNATGKWKVILVCNYDPAGNTGGSAF